jgi:hypothetical protein
LHNLAVGRSNVAIAVARSTKVRNTRTIASWMLGVRALRAVGSRPSRRLDQSAATVASLINVLVRTSR